MEGEVTLGKANGRGEWRGERRVARVGRKRGLTSQRKLSQLLGNL